VKLTPTLLGIPYDAGSSFLKGPALAPPRIREALWSGAGNPFSEAGIDLSAAGTVGDAGDVRLLNRDLESDRDAITAAVTGVFAAGGRPIALGGDHSVTFPLVRGVRAAIAERPLTLLLFDAHPDLLDEFEGSRHSHACPFARILEGGLVDRLVQVGIRTMSRDGHAQAERFGVEVIDMRAWAAGRRPEVSGAVYVSIDLDGLDPAFAPGVGHFEPGGLSVRELLTEIQRLPGPIVGGDVVEYNPTRDPDGRTAFVAAKLAKELASRMIETAR
jgi:agmatinase